VLVIVRFKAKLKWFYNSRIWHFIKIHSAVLDVTFGQANTAKTISALFATSLRKRLKASIPARNLTRLITRAIQARQFLYRSRDQISSNKINRLWNETCGQTRPFCARCVNNRLLYYSPQGQTLGTFPCNKLLFLKYHRIHFKSRKWWTMLWPSFTSFGHIWPIFVFWPSGTRSQRMTKCNDLDFLRLNPQCHCASKYRCFR
jgi:hypothetical protein